MALTEPDIQKAVIYNKVLPYCDNIDTESKVLLNTIKENLGKAVVMRELRPGAGIWIDRLNRYMRCFGLYFSKEDHLTFIRLTYELVTIPELEPTLLAHFSQTLIFLLQKKEVISPDDLILPWQPLFELCNRIYFEIPTGPQPYKYVTSLTTTLAALVHSVKFYFPLSATGEILERLRPNLCPYNNMLMINTVSALEWFLPVSLSPENSSYGYEAWLKDFMSLWKMHNNDFSWEQDMMWLIARLARYNIGYIDWEPYIPQMFNLFLRAFHLPVQYNKKRMFETKCKRLDSAAMALWIVSVMGGNSSCQKYFRKLMSLLALYYYPSNYGYYSGKLADFIRQITVYFVRRLNIERYKKQTWETPTKEGHCLTEDDITEFVETLKPIVMDALYSKMLPQIVEAFHHLANMRPKLIIVPVIERFNRYDDCMTEPHKLQATMECLIVLVRPMIEGKQNGFPEGPLNVIPLMMSFLPAIDSNDRKKTTTALNFYSMVFSSVPIVDCSQAALYWNDLTEEEQELCAATAVFEDFVVGFLDRCFLMITNSEQDSRFEASVDQLGFMESVFKRSLYFSFSGLLTQASSEIFKTALKMLVTFIKGNTFELNYAGEYLSVICQAFAAVNPSESLDELIPYLCSEILQRTESSDFASETNLDNTLLYHMLLLSKAVCTPAVIAYLPLVMSVLDRTLYVKCRKGSSMSCDVLAHMFHSLSYIVPQEYRSCPHSFDKDIKEYLPIRDWAICGDIHNLNLQWYVPGPKEIAAAETLLAKYLPPQIELINTFIDDDSKVTRESLHNCLEIVFAVLCCKSLLPVWDEPPVAISDSCIQPSSFQFPNGTKVKITMPGGENVRRTLVGVMHRLQERMLEKAEDYTQVFKELSLIWHCLFDNSSPLGDSWEMFNQYMDYLKKLQKNVLIGRKKHLRSYLVKKAKLQHELLCSSSINHLTSTHVIIMKDLLKLSTTKYSEIRCNSQSRLFHMVNTCFDSYKVLTDDILDYLKLDSNISHDQIKGILHVILGNKKCSSMLIVLDWHNMSRLWPAILNLMPSEKNSILTLINLMGTTLQRKLMTIAINIKVTDDCIKIARSLVSEPVQEDIGIQKNTERGNFNLLCFRQLETSLLDALEKPDLHWRWRRLAGIMLQGLFHPEVNYSVRSVKNFTEDIISEDIFFRKLGYNSMVHVLGQQMRAYTKVPLSSELCPRSDVGNQHVRPGVRTDNQWLLYNSERKPTSAKQWDDQRYIHKTHIGYYYWPQQILVHAASSQQPDINRTSSELSDVERPVDEFFSNPEKVGKLMYYLSLEDRKSSDGFDQLRFIMFKRLFRNYGDRYLNNFWPYLTDSVNKVQERFQIAAAELIAGLIRGSKLWSYEKIETFWEKILPLISQALNNMTEETVGDWAVCVATSAESIDPNRNHWLLELLLMDPIRDESSHISSSRLYCIQGALTQLHWKVPELYSRLLDFIKPHLDHPFQNIRERLGSTLRNVFDHESILIEDQIMAGPRIADFMVYVLSRLEILMCVPSVTTKVIPVEGGISSSSNSDAIAEDFANIHLTAEDIEKAKSLGDAKEIVTKLLKRHTKDLPEEVVAAFTKDVRVKFEAGDTITVPNDPADVPVKFEAGNTITVPYDPADVSDVPVKFEAGDTKIVPNDPTDVSVKVLPELDLPEEKQSAVRLLKTVCRCIISNVGRSPFGMSPHLYKLIPALCLMEGSEGDEELSKLCTRALSALCFCKVMPEHIPVLLIAVQNVAYHGYTWTARLALLDFLQVFVFCNMFILLMDKAWVQQVVDIVLKLLQDEWSEIRIKASETLSALFLADIIEDKEPVLELFKKQAESGKRKKKRLETPITMTAATIKERHSGILGLCAYINAYPYSIPRHVPEVLIFLTYHLYDPDPVSTAVTKCLDAFKGSHRNMIMELDSLPEELREVLRFGSVPPSYIA